MRRITALTIGIIMLGFIMVTKATAVDSKKEVSVNAAEQVILDLLYQPAAAAVAEYYGEPTQFWHPEILSIRKNMQTLFGLVFCDIVLCKVISGR